MFIKTLNKKTIDRITESKEEIKRKRRVVQYPFNVSVPSKDFSYPVLLFQEIKELNLDEFFAVVLYRDKDTKEWVLFLVKKNEDFLLIPIPDAVAHLLDKKTKNFIIVANARLENIHKKEGKIFVFGRKIEK